MTLGRRIAQLEAAKRRNAGGLEPGLRVLAQDPDTLQWHLAGEPISADEAMALMKGDHQGIVIVRFVDPDPLPNHPGALTITRAYGKPPS